MSDISHTNLLAHLDSETRLALLERSDGRGLMQLAAHLGVLSVTGSWIMAGLWGWPLLLLGHGIVLVFLFTPLHETIHETAFARRGLNRAVAAFCGFVLILPPRWFRAFHFAHHRHTNDPENDPELATPPPHTWHGYVWRLTGIPVWREHVFGLVRIANGNADDGFIPPKARGKIIREAQLFVLGYALLLTISVIMGSTALLWVWIVPAVLGQPVLRAYLMAEHTLCPHSSNMLENSRTTFTARLIRALAWNMPYHAEHHSYPNVPFHKLPAFHAWTRDHLKTTANGYGAFHREMLETVRSPPRASEIESSKFRS